MIPRFIRQQLVTVIFGLWVILCLCALIYVSRAECYVCVGGCGSQSECVANCACVFPSGQTIGQCVGSTP